MSPLRSPHRLLPLLAAAALAGCGAQQGGGAATTIEPGERLRVAMDEYVFEPQDVSVRPGRLRVLVENEGSLAHNWRVVVGKRELGGSETFQGGGRRRFAIDLKPGAYKIVCTVGNHEELGMRGVLEVEKRRRG